MRAAKVQASLRIRAVSPEPSLLAHTSSESRGTFRQKARSLAPLNGWACAVKICHDGMLKDTNLLDAAQIINPNRINFEGTLNLFCLWADPRVHVNQFIQKLFFLNLMTLYKHTFPFSRLWRNIIHTQIIEIIAAQWQLKEKLNNLEAIIFSTLSVFTQWITV